MKIVIDARWIFPEISGIGAYTRELIRHLAIIDTQHHYTLLFQAPDLRDRTLAETDVGDHPRIQPQLLPYGLFSIRNQVRLPTVLKRLEADIYHSTNYMMPLAAFPPGRPHGCRCVTTIHDVIPLIFPRHAPRSKKARLFPLYRRLMREVGARADAIITDSRASAHDVAHHLAIPDSRQNSIHTIHCGVDQRFAPSSVPRTRNDGGGARLLYVGRSDPYKNVTTLIRAFAAARQQVPVPLRLTIAGSPDPRYPEAQALAREYDLEDSVHWTGYVSDDELLQLYQSCDALVHPSRYEGFGLQILEAMACGLPVITSNGGSLPEVAGDAAIVLSPDDTAGFAASIVKVLTDPSLAADLRRRGLAQAARFTWQATARATLAVYSALASDATGAPA